MAKKYTESHEWVELVSGNTGKLFILYLHSVAFQLISALQYHIGTGYWTKLTVPR